MRVLRDAFQAFTSVFGCQHGRLSRPFTIEQRSYMVCLDCGHKLFYSMQEMRRLSRREVRRLHAARPETIHLSPANALEPAATIDPSLAA